MALPKKHIENMRLRSQAIGNARRRELMGMILDKSVNFPKGVVLKDIDKTFVEWVEKDLYITFEGSALPTFKLFSNQRISEYAQNWSHTDSLGNLLMNFKTVSRENNPKKGSNQGQIFNIPGNRDYVMGHIPVLQENGQEAFDLYTMKQPYTVDLIYTVTIITNKYELLNEMNQLVQNKFSALQCYLFPNGHAMPMKLSEVSDESEYNLEDRKYYSQSYKIELLAYIVDPKDFKVTHLPSRIKTRVVGVKEPTKQKTVKVSIEDWDKNDSCPPTFMSPYENQKMTIIIDFPECKTEVEFMLDTDAVIESIELDNIYDFVLCANSEKQNLENDETKLYDGDNIHISITRDDLFKASQMKIICYNPNIVYDSRHDPESSLDENNTDLELIVE